MLAYTRPGDLVVVASGTCLAGPTIEGLRRRCADLTAALAQPATANVVLMTSMSLPSLGLVRVTDQFRMAGQVLRPGGLLVAVTWAGCSVDRAAVGCRLSDAVRAAQRAGFGYLQHNVAVEAPMTGDELPPGPPWRVRSRSDAGGPPVHRVAHSDVLVFTAPGSIDG